MILVSIGHLLLITDLVPISSNCARSISAATVLTGWCIK